MILWLVPFVVLGKKRKTKVDESQTKITSFIKIKKKIDFSSAASFSEKNVNTMTKISAVVHKTNDKNDESKDIDVIVINSD